jgi:CheY-like chemotaxis protein
VRRIAIVEDNPDNRLLVRALLEGSYLLSEYETGSEALAGFEHEEPDLVLLDISLPGMDGIAILQRLRSDRRWLELPVIAVTAHAMSGDRERLLALGFDDYIAKPILDPHLLIASIEALCQPGSGAKL